MSVTSRSPLRLAGATIHSGFPGTGEQQYTLGGVCTATVYSGNAVLSGALLGIYSPFGAGVGTGYDVLVCSGAGRLKAVVPNGSNISGVNVIFYDAGAVSSGGPFPASGHKIIGTVPGNAGPAAGLGLSGTLSITPPALIQYDMPFTSGLCIALKSGQLGFTVSYTPEINLPNPG